MSRKTKKDLTKELALELDAFDNTITSLIELLEEKGILTQEELENRTKDKVARAGGLIQYRDIQFTKK